MVKVFVSREYERWERRHCEKTVLLMHGNFQQKQAIKPLQYWSLISFYQLWIKRSGSQVHWASCDYLKRWDFMGSKRVWTWDLEGLIAVPLGRVLQMERFLTNSVNWVLMLPLVHQTSPEDWRWEVWWKCGSTGWTIQTCCDIWPVKWVPWSLWSSRGVPQVRIIFSKRILGTEEAVACLHGKS